MATSATNVTKNAFILGLVLKSCRIVSWYHLFTITLYKKCEKKSTKQYKNVDKKSLPLYYEYVIKNQKGGEYHDRSKGYRDGTIVG